MVHRQPSTAHPGRTKTETLVKNRYWWPGWRHDVKRYVANCLICNRTTTRRDLPPGLLQPLDIPNRPWEHISMDFRSCPKDKHGFDEAWQKPFMNGHTEIVNQYFAQKLRPFVNYYQDNWSELLPAIDFAYAVLEHETTGLSPFQVERGYEPRVSFDWVSPSKPRDRPHDQAEARQTARNLEQIWDYAKGQIELA
ncbi:integrase zinc binding domain-containing protein, partial [Aspergillus affinis]|uniref:integrase zinc binding domain-containing protein n=1 Tax=Aspergillus affinis TaxID=1070780 RepID=UPI0022FDD372